MKAIVPTTCEKKNRKISTRLPYKSGALISYRDEVEREEHKVANDGAWRELLERFARQLAEPRNGIARTTRLDLALFGNEVGLALGDEGTVKGVSQAVLDEQGLREHHCQGATLAQDKQDSAQCRQWPAGEDEHRNLWEVREEEHARGDA